VLFSWEVCAISAFRWLFFVIVYRLFDFRRVPPVSGRYINLSSEILPLASKHLNKTFYTSPGNLYVPVFQYLNVIRLKISTFTYRHLHEHDQQRFNLFEGKGSV